MKKSVPDFVIDYDRKLKKQAQKINSRINKGEEIFYCEHKVNKVEFLSFVDYGTSEAYVYTEEGLRYNAGSQIFQL